MNKLKIILQSKKIMFKVAIITLLITIIRINLPPNIIYHDGYQQITGRVIRKEITKEKLIITVKARENVEGTFYFKTKPRVKLGDKVTLEGNLFEPISPGTKNIFNYKDYLKTQNIFHLMKIEKLTIKEKSINPYYLVKEIISQKNPYIKALILGDKSGIKEEVLESYQLNGISHLFAISGMHIHILSSIILLVLKKFNFKEKTQYKILTTSLLFYLLLVGITPSVIRGVLFFLLFFQNRLYLNLSKETIILITIIITLLISPYALVSAAFWYSFTISIGLIYFSDKKTSYWKGLLKTSILSFLLSIPISLYYFYQINLLSILYNLFYIPLMTVIFFPLTLITLLIPFLEPIYQIFINIFEKTSLYLSNIKIFVLIFSKVSLIIYLSYLVLIFLILKKQTTKFKAIFFFLLLIHYFYPLLIKDFIKIIDVGQGDSILLYSKGKSALVDTGGKINYDKNYISKTVTKYTTIPLLKSLGIKKLDYVLLTHGDLDHMGEIFYLKEHFSIGKIYINQGFKNSLEKKLIKTEDVNIAFENMTKKIGNFYLTEINTNFKDENTSSSVYYLSNNNLTMLLMGDATVETENYLLSNYDLKVDIIKLGHHGSSTSSSGRFLSELTPKLALISVGKDNNFNHPSKEVLKRLEALDIPYLTTMNSGTITIYPTKKEVTEDRQE